MGKFSDMVRKWSVSQKRGISEAADERLSQAVDRAEEALGEDMAKLRGATFVRDTGKFANVSDEDVREKLRAVDLLEE